MYRIYQNGVPVQWTMNTEKECKGWISRAKKMNKELQKRYGSMMIVPDTKYTYKEEL